MSYRLSVFDRHPTQTMGTSAEPEAIEWAINQLPATTPVVIAEYETGVTQAIVYQKRVWRTDEGWEAESISRGLADALAGRVYPIGTLWDGLQEDEVLAITAGPAGEAIRDPIMENTYLKQGGKWKPADELPDESLDGRKFWVLSGKFERVGTYRAAEDGWMSEGVLMDVTQYWSEPLPLPPGKSIARPSVAKSGKAPDNRAVALLRVTMGDEQLSDDAVWELLNGPAGETIHDLVIQNGHLKKIVEGLETRLLEFSLANVDLALLNVDLQDRLGAVSVPEGKPGEPTTINWQQIRASTFEPPSVPQWRFELQDGTVLHVVSMGDYEVARQQIRRASQDIIEAQTEAARLRDELNQRNNWQRATGKLAHGRYAVINTYRMWDILKYDGDWHLRQFSPEPVWCFLLPPTDALAHEDEEE